MSAPALPDKGVLPTAPPPYSEVAPPCVGTAPPVGNYPSGYPQPPAYPTGPGYPPQPPQPPQSGFCPPQGPYTEQPTTVVYTSDALGSGPSRFFCPSCRREVLTNVTYESGLLTWILAILICFLGGPLFCCLIPFCCPPCKDVEHLCPVCGRFLGSYQRF
ncbi:hypothetical protein TcWFU_004111 [Taenia crassiceps]|uniref:LITAF domain-containing protein n=1 Tax=Taenia crassiceps TaxID=6207 RepID=A0ABR4QCZ2_9CEST